MKAVPFEILKGKTLHKLEVFRDLDKIFFYCSDGTSYKMYHDQSCCESVIIEDICGDPQILVGDPILIAEERTNFSDPKDNDNSFTWTFYEIATIQGAVTLRWYGSSNGWYSESVDFVEIEPRH